MSDPPMANRASGPDGAATLLAGTAAMLSCVLWPAILAWDIAENLSGLPCLNTGRAEQQTISSSGAKASGSASC